MEKNEVQQVESTTKLRPLTPKQQRFVEEYLIDLNATAAAIRAGYSPDTAKEIGCENLSKLNVRAYVDIALAERSKRTGVNAEVVVRELARIALANPARVVAEDGSIIDGASEDDLAAIQAIKVKTKQTKAGVEVEREIRFSDKNKALELLGKHLGMFIERKELTGKDGGPIQLEAMTTEQREQRIKELIDKREE
ncbi:terminase small subunit [Desulfosporosinus acididurans]|uniref:Terminase small subunit n=1 Tax=Desulfosporosinus acididurans TaxID=476652 RepID=A0A0J1FTJ6_9FIRM|nr:terminase small subunit [Desulfosporosinus acididurans]KLU66318.1 terminase small subunit [Desulfosporosinus acididurans]